MEAQHLFLPFVINDVTLEATRANGSDRAEFVTRAEQMLTGLDGTGTVNDLFKPFGLVGRQSAGEAKLTQSTTTAGDLCAGGLTAVISNIGYS
jgi:hypothetical protein